MVIRPIRNETDHAAAVAEIERLWGAAPGTLEGDRLDVLATLVDAYESKAWPIVTGDPIDILRYAIDDMGHTQAELARMLGSRSRASEVLNRRRSLTVEMIDGISRQRRIPVELLARPYALAGSSPGDAPRGHRSANPTGGGHAIRAPTRPGAAKSHFAARTAGEAPVKNAAKSVKASREGAEAAGKSDTARRARGGGLPNRSSGRRAARAKLR